MVENTDSSIADAIKQVLGESSTLEPYTSVLTSNTTPIQNTDTDNNSIISNIEPVEPITESPQVEQHTDITSNETNTIQPHFSNDTKQITSTPTYNPSPAKKTDLEQVAPTQVSLDKEPTPAPVTTSTLEPTSNDTKDFFTPTTDLNTVENKSFFDTDSTAPESKENKFTLNQVTPVIEFQQEQKKPDLPSTDKNVIPPVVSNITPQDEQTPNFYTPSKIILDNVVQKDNTIKPKITEPVLPDKNINPELPSINSTQTFINEVTPTAKFDQTQPSQTIKQTVNKIDNIEPASIEPPDINKIDNIEPASIEPSAVETGEMNSSTLPDNISIDHPSLYEIASNTKHTNNLLESLTRAIYGLKPSNTTSQQPPIIVPPPINSSIGQMDSVPEAVTANYSGMIPSIRRKFI